MSPRDEKLAGRLRRGDAGAFEALFDAYAKPLLGYLTRMLQDRAAAEDALQETMIRVYRRIGHYREEGAFRAWIYRIATNLALTELRRRRWTTQETGNAGAWDPPDPAACDALEQLVGSERDRLIRAGLMEIPDGQRAVLLLRINDRMGIKEIAQTLCLPEGTVKSRIHHAVRALRDFVRDREDGETRGS